MAFMFGSSSGVSIGSSSLSLTEQRYAPVFDEEITAEFMWNLLPSFYQTFMSDQDIFNSLWASTLPAVAAETLNLWHVDYAKSLLDVPIFTQRKWVKLDLVEDEAFDTDPSPQFLGIENLFVVDEEADELTATWQNRGGVDRAYKPLRGEITEDCSVSWSFEFTLSSLEQYGTMLVGYMNSDSSTLSNALMAGVIGISSTEAEFFILHAASSTDITHRRSSIALSTDTVYRITCSYAAGSTELTGSVVELSYEKVSSTTGVTGEDDSGTYSTNQVTDTSVSLSDAGVTTSDYLVYDERKYSLLEVQDTVFYTSLALLPAEGTISYTIVGEETLSSLSVNLESTAGDSKFTSDAFGTCVVDTRNARSFLVPQAVGEADAAYTARYPSAYSSSQSKKLVGTTTNWQWSDPTSTYPIIHLPRIQDSYTEATSFLYEHIDYSIDGRLMKFHEPPPAVMYAEYVAYDEKKIYNNFGHFVGVGKDEVSSEALRSRIRGLFYSYLRGPTLSAIRTGVQIHLGLPIAEEEGTVEAVNEAYSGEYGQIVVNSKGYLYPLAVGTTLSVSDSVAQFQVLSEGVRVLDYVNTPNWIDYFTDEPYEVQKYHQFLVEMNLDAFDVEDLTNAAVFVDAIKPTWKGATFLAFKAVEDDQDVEDDLYVGASLGIFDSFIADVDPLYSGRFFGSTPSLPSAGSLVEGTTGGTTLTGVRVGVSSEYVSGSYWISDWVLGGAYSGETIAGLSGALNVTGHGGALFEAATYVFDSTSPGLDGFVRGIRDDTGFTGEYFARAFVEKRNVKLGNEYRIHIFSNPSLGEDHRLTIDDDTVNPWAAGFNWYDLRTDPVLFEGLYPSRQKKYDWAFDSGIGEWDTPALSVARTAELNTRNLLWRDTSAESFFLTGEGSIVEGHNRPASPLVEDHYSGDSAGVRTRFTEGDLVAEIGTLVTTDGAATTASAAVPAFLADPPSTVLAVTISGGTFKTSGSSDYIPHTSADGEPVFPVFVQLKWSATSDWETDGVGGTGYQYASAEVLQVSSDTELIINADSLPTVATSDVTVEVRRGGPIGTIVSNGEISDANGATSGLGYFSVASSGLPDFTSADSHGANLSGVTLKADVTGLRTFPDDKVYLAVRSTSLSSVVYASQFSYSGWYIFEVEGLHLTDNDKLYFVMYGAATASDLEWVLFINPERRLSLHRGSSGSTAVVVADDDKIDLEETEELFSSTGIEIYQPSEEKNPRFRTINWADANKIPTYNVGKGDSITISGAHAAVNGTYPVYTTGSVSIGTSDWPTISIDKYTKTFLPALFDSAGLYSHASATITVSRRANYQIRPDYAECRIVVGEDTYTVKRSEYLETNLEDADSTQTSIEVDNVFSTSEDLGTWYSYDVNPTAVATAVFLHTDEYVSLAERWAGENLRAGVVPQVNEQAYYRAALVDNDYYEVYFDTQIELAPDEDVSLRFLASPGIGNRTFRVGSPDPIYEDHTGFHLWSPSQVSYSLYESYLTVPLWGTLLCKGEAGGRAATSTTGTSSDSSATAYYIFEDLSATFTSDITDLDGNDQPNNLTFVCLTENTDHNEKLWEDWISNIEHQGTALRSPRLITLQVIEVVSDKQLLLRFYATGEDATTSYIEDQWFGNAGHLKYSIRDDTGIDTATAHLLSPTGVWYSLASYHSAGDAMDISGLPGSLATGLPYGHPAVLSSSYPNNWPNGYTRRGTVETWHCPYFFTATLTNGSATITPDGSVADFNQFAKEALVDGCYLQVAPTPFTTLEDTDTTDMIADGPVFKAALVGNDAAAIITITGIPSSPFTVTFDNGTPVAVTISDGGVSWTSVEDVKHSIITAFTPHDTAILAGETYPTSSPAALELRPVGRLFLGAGGNSITLATSDSVNISLPATFSGGIDAAVSVHTGTYAGVTAASTRVVLRATTSPFPISIASESLSDWYTQSSGDTASIDIEEQVPE